VYSKTGIGSIHRVSPFFRLHAFSQQRQQTGTGSVRGACPRLRSNVARATPAYWGWRRPRCLSPFAIIRLRSSVCDQTFAIKRCPSNASQRCRRLRLDSQELARPLRDFALFSASPNPRHPPVGRGKSPGGWGTQTSFTHQSAPTEYGVLRNRKIP
jgi:hypothetical protein